MIVSMQMAVLPVLRSPIISSRCPRPMGVIASMALMPVCSGTLTGWRPATPGASDSTRRRSVVCDRPAAVQRIAQRVDHAAEHGVAHRHGEQPAGAAHFVALVDREEIAENDHADGVFFEVEGQADDAARAAGELDHLARHHAGEPVDAGDAVADLDHAADLADVDARLELLNFLLNDGSDLVGFEFHGHSCR